ncbi:MAG: MFS transporter [Chloroflexi bacterium]|nr:MFS transporter [Chloroflexota bacterium]
MEDRNAWLLVAEMFWTAILGAAVSFNSAYVVRLGGSNSLVGLLTSGPALMTILLTLPAARLMEWRGSRKAWVVWSIFLQRVLYLPIALMPFFVQERRAEAFVALFLLRELFLAPNHAGWNAFYADLLPGRRRVEVLAQRRIMDAALLVVAVPLVGEMLDKVVFPYGYQIAYGLAFVTGMISVAMLFRLRLPEGASASVQRAPATKQRFSLRRVVAENPVFFRYTAIRVVYNLGMSLAQPLYIIYFVRVLGASDAWLGFRLSVGNVAILIGYWFWPRIVNRYGDLRVMRWMAPVIALYPLGVALSQDLNTVVAIIALMSLVTPATNLTFFNTSINVCPPERRTSYMSLYTTAINVTGFLGPLIGVALSEVIGIAGALMVASAIRMMGGALFSLFPLEKAGPLPGSMED